MQVDPLKMLRFLSIIFILSFFIQQARGNTPTLDVLYWKTALEEKGKKGNQLYQNLDTLVMNQDSAAAFQFLDLLAREGNFSNRHFKAKYNILLAANIYFKRVYDIRLNNPRFNPPPAMKEQVKNLYADAIDLAYRVEDDYLVVLVATEYSKKISQFNEMGLSIMYSIKRVDLSEALNEPVPAYDYQFLSEMLFRAKEYEISKKYALKSATLQLQSPEPNFRYSISSINTVALGFHRLEQYDSALYYYEKAAQLAREHNGLLWERIVYGNVAQVLYTQGKYDTAYRSFKREYEMSVDSSLFHNAANSSQWAARCNLALGNPQKALAEARESLILLEQGPDDAYLRNTYFTLTQVFKELKIFDSAFYYNNLYFQLNDSLERMINRSSLEITQARLNDEASKYNIQAINREIRSQILLRNSVIVGIVLLSITALLLINRKRLKAKMLIEKVELEKWRMVQEIETAKTQMKMFTENIVEKTSLIESLEAQIKDNKASEAQQLIMEELSQQTILTDDDWIKFKQMFEKIHPMFFSNLQQKSPQITLAEQRMAALTKLRLTTRQIASMSGISVYSVHKSRQRLRQRFQIGTDDNLAELLADL